MSRKCLMDQVKDVFNLSKQIQEENTDLKEELSKVKSENLILLEQIREINIENASLKNTVSEITVENTNLKQELSINTQSIKDVTEQNILLRADMDYVLMMTELE